MSDPQPSPCNLFPVEVQWAGGAWVVFHGPQEVGSYPRQQDALAHVRRLLQEMAGTAPPEPRIDAVQPGDQVSQTSSLDR